MREERLKDDKMLGILTMLSPGTNLREGLENILRARTGALIVIGDSEEFMKVVNGGFLINKEFSPSFLYELAKMDGAIIISKDLKKILYANSLLIPNPTIHTEETGTRHKSAERTAIQTGEVVICISQRRNIITLYKDSEKYILRDTSSIITKANQALQTLERYKAVLDNATNNLSVLEFEDIVTLDDVAVVLQRTEMVMRIVTEIDRYICELGNEGRLISMQLEELIAGVEEDGKLVVEDYMIHHKRVKPDDILRKIRMFTYDELKEISNICVVLGYSDGNASFDVSVSPKGYRLMKKVPRVPMNVVRNTVAAFSDLQSILKASIEDLDDVEGIGEVRARIIKDGLKRVRDQLFLDARY